MNIELLDALTKCETDIEGALRRFCGNEALYTQCLDSFLQDQTMTTLETALAAQNWDDAFTAAHALKGLAGNMGFVPLFHAVAELVILIRTGRVGEIRSANGRVKRCYTEIVNVIARNQQRVLSVKGELL